MKYTHLMSGLVGLAILPFCSGCLVVSTHKVNVSGNVNVSGGVPVVVRANSQPTQAVHPVSCCLTSAENYLKGKRIPVATFTSQDFIRLYVTVGWDDPSKGAGVHDIVYNWYKGDKLVSTFNRQAELVRTPADLHSTRAASDLGTGHFKAEILVDKMVMGSQAFDIAP
jgi:hypothetical protein